MQNAPSQYGFLVTSICFCTADSTAFCCAKRKCTARGATEAWCGKEQGSSTKRRRHSDKPEMLHVLHNVTGAAEDTCSKYAGPITLFQADTRVAEDTPVDICVHCSLSFLLIYCRCKSICCAYYITITSLLVVSSLRQPLHGCELLGPVSRSLLSHKTFFVRQSSCNIADHGPAIGMDL